MKFYSFIVLAVIASVASGYSTAYKQQQINGLLYKVTEPIKSTYTNLHEAELNWNPKEHLEGCISGGKSLLKLLKDHEDHKLLEKKHWFSLFNEKQREEALLMVDVLLHCEDFDHFVNNAAFFRKIMNEGEFIYALYIAVTHSDETRDVELPPLYEITPQMFIDNEVIEKAYAAKMTQTPAKIITKYSGSQNNPEQRVAYFGEDVGMNSHHVHWHMDFPFWWDGHKIDRKGELFFWAHHQLTARFDAERLSNNLPVVDELYWDKPIAEGFAPHATYRYGGEFPSRPDNKEFEDVEGVARIRDMKTKETRIREAIALGYITDDNGNHIFLDNEHGIDILGNVMESSKYSPNPHYYGSLHNYAHMMLGRQADPRGKFGMPPGTMEHFETATRDPAFFRLHKYIDNIFKEHKDSLPAYTKDDLLYENAEITDIKVIGDLTTFFEPFEIDLTNGVDDSEKVEDVPISAVVSRLNHKPFTYDIEVTANHAEPATVRIFLCPKFDSNGIEYTLDEARWGCIEMDKFWVHLSSGKNSILRKSSESSVAIPDRKPFHTLIEETDAAVASGVELDHKYVRACGHPNRLLLPKGSESGVDFELFVTISSGNDATFGYAVNNEFGSTHGYCGIKGQKYPDKKPMGYPLDRKVPDDRLFKVKNINWVTVSIKHEH